MKTFEQFLTEAAEDATGFHLRKAENHSTMMDIGTRKDKIEAHEAAYKAHLAASDAHRKADKSKSKEDRAAAKELSKTAGKFSRAIPS